VDAVAASIAIGALKYFLLKYGRNKVVAFDFEEVLAFEGETGPYVQYAVVRASNIFAKLRERQGYRLADLAESLRRADYGYLEEADDAAAGGTDHWELVLEITRLGQVVSGARATLELSALAKHLFNLAQLFNGWYHKYRVLDEPDEGVRHLRILITHLFRRQMIRGLDLMGIGVPARM
jgi:arginyl-tRNA synthetase